MFTGHWEILVIAVIALLLFGHRLPSVMRSLGRGVVEFKRGVQGVEDSIDEATKSVSHDGSSEDQAAS